MDSQPGEGGWILIKAESYMVIGEKVFRITEQMRYYPLGLGMGLLAPCDETEEKGG